MAERSTINQLVQIAPETAIGNGTAPAGNYATLKTIGIEPSPKVEIDQFKPAGSKFKTFAALSKEWVTASISGRPSYNEIIWLLSGVLCKGANASMTPATKTWQWLYSPSNTADDTVSTYVLIHGSSARYDKISYAMVSELGLSFSRAGIDLTGSMIGRAMSDGTTIGTAGTGVMPTTPVLPTQVSVYVNNNAAATAPVWTGVYSTIADSIAAPQYGLGSAAVTATGSGDTNKIGVGRLTRLISVDWNIGNRFTPVYTLDSIGAGLGWKNGFVTHIEAEPDLSMNMTVEADLEGMGLLNTMRDGDTKSIRIEAVGTKIETATADYKYKLRIDTMTKVVDTGGFRDSDGLYAIDWSLAGVYDAGWGKATEVTVWNEMPISGPAEYGTYLHA